MNEETLPINEEAADQEEAISTMMDQFEEFLSEGEYDYQLPKRGDVHTGVVIEIGDRGAIVDAGFKRDGIVPAGDLDRLDEETRESIQPGDEVTVTVRKPQDDEGRLILSIYEALVQEDWRKAEQMMEEGELYEGTISGFNRGGLLVPFGRIRGFIPASHTVGMPRGLKGEERRERLADMVGDEVGLKIIEVDRHRRRLILSQRQARRAWQKIQRKRVMEELTEGESVVGTVTGITDFGAFVDLGGADGLIHISELSWKQVDDPREVVEVGDEVEVYVLNLDWDRTRIALSLKRLRPNPWSQVADHYEVGQLVEGKVSRVLDFGAFVELDLGVEGLLHVSEMTGASQLSPTDILSAGQKVLVKIIGIDTHKQRITLSARQVHRDQWERWMAENKITAEEEAPEAPEELEDEAVAEAAVEAPEAVEEEEVVAEAAVEEPAVAEAAESEPAEAEAAVAEEEAVAEPAVEEPAVAEAAEPEPAEAEAAVAEEEAVAEAAVEEPAEAEPAEAAPAEEESVVAEPAVSELVEAEEEAAAEEEPMPEDVTETPEAVTEEEEAPEAVEEEETVAEEAAAADTVAEGPEAVAEEEPAVAEPTAPELVEAEGEAAEQAAETEQEEEEEVPEAELEEAEATVEA